MLPGSTAAPNGGAGAAGAGQQALFRTTKVLLLLNIVAPGCVDNELEAEIRTECQSKYGPVLRVLIYEVRAAVRGVGTSVAVPPDARVRIFVSLLMMKEESFGDVVLVTITSKLVPFV